MTGRVDLPARDELGVPQAGVPATLFRCRTRENTAEMLLAYHSRTTLFAFLSSRNPTNFE
jgi:hypothetical protein